MCLKRKTFGDASNYAWKRNVPKQAFGDASGPSVTRSVPVFKLTNAQCFNYPESYFDIINTKEDCEHTKQHTHNNAGRLKAVGKYKK